HAVRLEHPAHVAELRADSARLDLVDLSLGAPENLGDLLLGEPRSQTCVPQIVAELLAAGSHSAGHGGRDVTAFHRPGEITSPAGRSKNPNTQRNRSPKAPGSVRFRL